MTEHHRVSPEGRSSGFLVCMLVEPIIQDIVRAGGPDERCKSCAGLYGTVPNGCIQTQADFIKAGSEGLQFNCHVNIGKPCQAWIAMRIAHRGAKHPAEWEFSPPDEAAT